MDFGLRLQLPTSASTSTSGQAACREHLLRMFPFYRIFANWNSFEPVTAIIDGLQRQGCLMPEISRFYGIIITIFVHEHNPPHFHVRYNEYRALINIENGEITGSLPRRALNLVYDWLDLHKDELMENWRRMERGGELKSIKPLD